MKARYLGKPYKSLTFGFEYEIEVRGGDQDQISVQVLNFKEDDNWIEYCWQVHTLEELFDEWEIVGVKR